MRTFRLLLFYILFLMLVLAVLPLIFISGKQADINYSEKDDVSPVIKIESETGDIFEDTLEHFLLGVVAAEMPRSFPLEALKAQAIAARTYIYGQMGKGLYNGADTCVDPNRAQAWIDLDEVLPVTASNVEDSDWQKIYTAVESTCGIVVTYNGEIASTPYCSTCGGQTADASEVWGNSLPWLISIECPYDTDSPKYDTIVSYQNNELTKLLDVNQSDLQNITITERTASGRVANVKVGNKNYTGQEIRKLLSLNSTNFSICLMTNKVVFNVRGYGHGVGLCQYGAKGMADTGKTYEEILTYYYHGIELTKAY